MKTKIKAILSLSLTVLMIGGINQSAAAESETEMTAEQKRIAGIVLAVTGGAIIGVAQGSKEDAKCTFTSRTFACTEDNHDKVKTATIAGGVVAIGGLILFATNAEDAPSFHFDEESVGISFSVDRHSSIFFGNTDTQKAAVQYRIDF